MPKRKTKNKRKSYLAHKIVIGIIGLVLSILAHELFHIAMHWPYVTYVGLFPNHNAIAEVLVWLPAGYDLEGEEIAAYLITLIIMIMTIIVIFRVGDETDQRSSSEILFPNDKRMQKLSPTEMLQLAGLDERERKTVTVRRIRRKKPVRRKKRL